MKYRDAPLYEWIQKNNVFTATTGQWLLIIHDDEEGAWNDPESRFSWSLRIRHRASTIFTDVDGGYDVTLEEAQQSIIDAFWKVCNP